MADFYQNGIITTLHNIADRPIEDLEKELLTFSMQRPMGLILPSLFSELEGPALQNVQEIALNTRALDADRVKLELRIDLVFLYRSIENLLIRVFHVAVSVH